jgi:hypothetical protein
LDWDDTLRWEGSKKSRGRWSNTYSKVLPELGNPISQAPLKLRACDQWRRLGTWLKRPSNLLPGPLPSKEAKISSQRKRGLSHVVLEERDGGDGWKEGGGEALGFLAGTAACWISPHNPQQALTLPFSTFKTKLRKFILCMHQFQDGYSFQAEWLCKSDFLSTFWWVETCVLCVTRCSWGAALMRSEISSLRSTAIS